jgi:metal-responsive CopG/Arc/MetJ family transcriptional regulator
MWSLSTTQTQTDELDEIRAEYGIRSRAEVARMAIDAGLKTLRKQLESSTLVERAR